MERVTLPDGERRAWYVAKFPLPERPGRERLWGGLAAEISGAFDYEQQLAMALEASEGGTWVWEADAGAEGDEPPAGSVCCSEGCWRMLGMKPDDVPAPACTWLDRAHPDDRDALADQLDRMLRGGVAKIEAEVRLEHADGGWRWVRTVGRATRARPGGPPAADGGPAPGCRPAENRRGGF